MPRNDGGPLRYRDVQATFLKLLKMSDLTSVTGRRPRLHELRHTFAVRALEGSPTERQRIGQHMLALAAFSCCSNLPLKG